MGDSEHALEGPEKALEAVVREVAPLRLPVEVAIRARTTQIYGRRRELIEPEEIERVQF